GGDAFYGPKSVVEAVACGKEAAESIHRYVNGLDLKEGREKTWEYVKPETAMEAEKDRVNVRRLNPEARECNFLEVSFGYNEEEAKLEADRCLKCGICSECYQCVEACLAEAIDHNQEPEQLKLDVGSVVLCPGSELFDPSIFEEHYHYKNNPNVLTSLEFERILSATGPTMGHLLKPLSEEEPKRIAWLQCIGSRDNNRCGNGYCSSVCCMYAIKDAMIAKEHATGDLDCVIFNMDIRTFGKDYETYYNRAKDREGVRFINARIHTIDEVHGSDELKIRYADESGEIKEDIFDMIVLSVGLQISDSIAEMAHSINVDLNKYRFAATDPFTPVETSRPGVFACGIFQGPKDIPSSITEASAAACAAIADLADVRDTCTKSVEIPDEIDIEGQEPRIGVFVCNCGINIGGVVDVPAVREYAKTLPRKRSGKRLSKRN
ncbi:MAG: FAD-dependent oxidoreductase, partial [Deltaproteobacteria bacterium]|nr:FAD-dependent oxidoreductase [Deltaproteobacteria bacterium]